MASEHELRLRLLKRHLTHRHRPQTLITSDLHGNCQDFAKLHARLDRIERGIERMEAIALQLETAQLAAKTKLPGSIGRTM